MTLSELCEPMFDYICRLNRLARAGAEISADKVRADVKAILARIRETAAQNPGMLPKFEMKEDRDGKHGIELVLIFFADFMIRESGLPCARDWQDIAEEYDEYGGDEKFFDLLDRTLEDRSREATEQLAVYYTCMGLGFTGGYAGQPEMVRRKMIDCAARLRDMMDEDDTLRICREAYEHTDRRPLNLPPVGRLVNWCVAFAAIILVVFIVSGIIYHQSQRELSRAVDQITGYAEPNVQIVRPSPDPSLRGRGVACSTPLQGEAGWGWFGKAIDARPSPGPSVRGRGDRGVERIGRLDVWTFRFFSTEARS